MKFINNKYSNKIILIFLIICSIKIFCGCDFTTTLKTTPIEYSKIEVTGINNSDVFMDLKNTDTMYYEAVAMNITLHTKNDETFAYNILNRLKTLSFTQVKAHSIDVYYIPKYKIADIKITTLIDINETIKAGEEISKHILFYKNEYDMYIDKKKIINKLNSKQNNMYENSAQIILKTTVINTKAQFKIDVVLDNNTILTDTTNVFTIIKK